MLTIGINRVFHLNNYHDISLQKQKDSGSWLAFVPPSQVIVNVYIQDVGVKSHCFDTSIS